MEEVENKNVDVEFGDDKKECPLNIYTPEMIIERLSNKDECTEDVIELIKRIQPNVPKLKKLSKIFTSLSNCDHIGITEVTRSKNRSLRLVSTYLIFSKMCEWCKEGHDYETVSALYKEVFLVRYRDVDPNIRALCAEFIADWISISPRVFCTNTYLKYLGLYLNDKSDIVRKKSLLSLIKLVEKNLELEELVSKNIKRIIEIASYDKNTHVREEARNLVLASYNASYTTKEHVYQILKTGEDKIKDTKLLNLTVWNILKYSKPHRTWKRRNYKLENESIVGYYEGLHELYVETSLGVVRRLLFDKQDLDHFVQFIILSLEEEGDCCEKEGNCYLKILSGLSGGSIKVRQALGLFEAFKDNILNIETIVEIVHSLPPETFKEDVESTTRLLEVLFLFVSSNRSKLKEEDARVRNITNNYFLLLKELETDFQTTVSLYIEKSQEDVLLRIYAVRSFDVSGCVVEEDYAETKIYASLWAVMNKDFQYVERLYLHQHVDLREVCELLFFVNSKVSPSSEYNDVCYDPETTLRRLHTKIKTYIKDNIGLLLAPNSLSYLFRFNEEAVLSNLVHLVFLVVQPEALNSIFGKIKNKNNIVEEFFVFLEKYYEVIGEDGSIRGGVSIRSEVSTRGVSIRDGSIRDGPGNTTLNLISELEDCTLKGSTMNVFSQIGESLLSEGERQKRDVDVVEDVSVSICDISKILGLKGRSLKEGLVFKALKKIVDERQTKLFDTVCVNFVSHLNSNECIVLDSKLDTKSRFKGLLSKRCKGPNLSSVMSENTTYL